MSGTLPCRNDTQCRPRFGDIWRCRRHVADMSPTCRRHVELSNASEAISEPKEAYFDKSSFMISNLVNKCWFSRYPRCKYVIYDNGSEFKLHFEDLCESYGLKRKPTSIRNPQANAILERVHQVVMAMIRTAELDMADSVAPNEQ